MPPEFTPVVCGKNDARYSVLAFRNRRKESQEHGQTRHHPEVLRFERPIGRNTLFERDIIKIKQSPDWRRLQGIYQFTVPLHEEQQHVFQNRITHTEDVQDVAATIARRMMLDRDSIDLVRCIAAIHDMGHMPFTHWGEQVAIEKLKPFGWTWKHDAAGLRVVAEWSNDGLTYPGLNLYARYP